MIEAILLRGGLLETAGGLLLVFVLHATVLLALVWAIERLGGLKHPGWAEFAWRVALFGAFVSVAIEALPTSRLPDRRIAAQPAAIAATERATASQAAGLGRIVQVADPVADTVAQTSARAPTTAPDARAAAPASMPTIDVVDVRVPIALPLTGDAILLALLLWSLGSFVLLARVLLQVRALAGLRRRIRREGRPASRQLARAASELAPEMGIAIPQLRVLPMLASPMVLPNTVLLPAWAEGLDAAQQRAMLAHELAHLRRRDPLWRPLQRLALVPLFFHPLAWHALRRLETLAETLCDRAAAERGDARALAECLAECLARSVAAPPVARGSGLALAMAERGDGIVGRVRTLLEHSHMKLSNISPRRLWIAGGLALLLLIALPGVIVIARPGGLGGLFENHDLSVTVRDGNETMSIRSNLPDGDRFRLAMDEDVTFTDDESDIARMDADARFELEQTRAGVTRAIAIVPGADGKLRRTYSVNGKPHAYDAEGRAWLAAAIPEVHRMTGMNAGARTKRLLARGGVPLVLKEIDLIRNDFAVAEYISQLFVQADLDDAQMDQLLARIAKMDSDYETRRALGAALKRPTLAANAQLALLRTAKGLDSDYERAEFLIAAADRLPVEGANAAAWRDALQAFGSDFERKRSLQALIQQGTPRAQAQAIALGAMRGMGSDFEQRSVLETAAEAGAPLPDAEYFAVVDAMSSDFEKREALQALIRSDAPDVARSRGVLQSARRMSSDFEAGEVLEALAKRMPNDKALIEDYRDVTRGMASDFERGEAEKALDRFYRG
jgi:beta-lactamase regulating signal transducer with metallopeptidase domain